MADAEESTMRRARYLRSGASSGRVMVQVPVADGVIFSSAENRKSPSVSTNSCILADEADLPASVA